MRQCQRATYFITIPLLMAAGCAAVAGDLCECLSNRLHSAGWVSFLFWNHDNSMNFHNVNGTFTLTSTWEIYLYVSYGNDVFVYNKHYYVCLRMNEWIWHTLEAAVIIKYIHSFINRIKLWVTWKASFELMWRMVFRLPRGRRMVWSKSFLKADL